MKLYLVFSLALFLTCCHGFVGNLGFQGMMRWDDHLCPNLDQVQQKKPMSFQRETWGQPWSIPSRQNGIKNWFCYITSLWRISMYSRMKASWSPCWKIKFVSEQSSFTMRVYRMVNVTSNVTLTSPFNLRAIAHWLTYPNVTTCSRLENGATLI